MKKKILILGIFACVVLVAILCGVGQVFLDQNDTDVMPIANNPDSLDTEKIYEVSGYYSTYDILMYPLDYDPNRDPYPATTTCSVFIVLDGAEQLTSDPVLVSNFDHYFKRVNSNGNIVFNVDPNDLPSVNKEALLESTVDFPIDLKIKMKTPLERDAYYCEGPVNLISVN